MQEAEMRGVDLAFQRLQPVAVALHQADVDLVRRQVEHLEAGQRRRLGALAHVDPDEAGALDDTVGLGLHLVLEILVLGHARHVDAVASNVVFPAVIDAAQAALLVAAEEQRGATMRAALVHHTHPARAVAEGDELFAKQHEAQRVAIALELRRLQRRQPVLPHQLAHRRAGADLREFRAFDRRGHGTCLRVRGGQRIAGRKACRHAP